MYSNLDRLEQFVIFVESGSMAAAAKRMHRTQPALSRAMKQLEETVGAALFEREGRRLVLSPVGRALLPEARALLEASRQALRRTQHVARRDYFDLRLGTVDSVATYLLPTAIDQLKQAFTGLHLKLQVGRSRGLLDAIENEELDLALVAYSGPPPDVTSERVGAYGLQHYGRRDRFPALAECGDVKQLTAFPLIEIKPSPGSQSVIPQDADTYAQTSTVSAVKALVMAGFGVGDLLPFMLNEEERAQVVAAQIVHDPDCGLFLVRSRAWQGETQQQIAQTLAAEIAKGL